MRMTDHQRARLARLEDAEPQALDFGDGLELEALRRLVPDDILTRLAAWATYMGGFDACVWDDLKTYLARVDA